MRDDCRAAKAAVRHLVAGVEGWLPEFEGELLFDLACRCSRHGIIVEIGSWKGRSTIWLASGSRAGGGATVYAIDPHTGSTEHQAGGGVVATFEEFQRNVATAGVADLVSPVLKPSREAVVDVPDPVALVFVDGAHEYEAVRLDFETWFPRLVEGGVMAFHDTTGAWEGPRRLVDERVLRSSVFRGVGLVGSITYGTKTVRAGMGDRARSRWVLTIKQTDQALKGLGLPAGVRALGRRVRHALQ
jgi:MMP 1-O-methyltransferase